MLLSLLLHFATKIIFFLIVFAALPNRGLVFVPDHLPLVRRTARWNLLHFCHHHRVRLPLPPGRYDCVSPARTLWRDDKIRLLAVSEMEPGSVGLALSYAVTLTGMFQWGVRQSAEIENMVRTDL